DAGELVGVRPQSLPQHVVRLGDQFHVAVLDAVVHHLDVVPGAVGADVRHARAGVALRGDGLEHRPYRLPRFLRATRHQRRTVTRPLFAAGDSGADEVEALRLHPPGSFLRVLEPGVASINDDVA